MKKLIPLLTLCATSVIMSPALCADSQRQAEVARLGVAVMPFSVEATTHVFTPTNRGGIQRVTAKNAADGPEVKLVRAHLRAIRLQFLKGDFSGPTHVHGAEMPGLAVLKASQAGQIGIDYEDVDAGAELTYVTSDARLVNALHDWFEAQLADHGSDAAAGHSQHHGHDSTPKP